MTMPGLSIQLGRSSAGVWSGVKLTNKRITAAEVSFIRVRETERGQSAFPAIRVKCDSNLAFTQYCRVAKPAGVDILQR